MSQAGIISVEGSDPQVPTQFDTDDNSAIPINNIIEILGANGITTAGSGNTVTISLTGGGAGIDSIAMQTGTSPVIPDGFGLVTFNGSSVASGTNPVRTNGTGANTLQLEVQTSQALAAADATKIGLSNFDSSSFAVAATGFVTASGSGLGKTITGDTDGALSPMAGNWNIKGGAALSAGTNAAVTSGSGNTLTVTAINTAKWIVDPTANRGTHQTIAAALTAASSGETIFIRPGTYTENLTLKAGVNLVANTADALTPNVTISGKLTLTTAGTVSISGICISSNGAEFLAVTGSAASIVNLINCYLTTAFDPGITFSSSSSSARINIIDCQGDISASAKKYFVHSSAGVLSFSESTITNSGASTIASTISSGTIDSKFSVFNFPITTSGTATYASNWCDINCQALNVTALTHGGSGATSRSAKSIFISGSAAAVSIGATLTMDNCEINSTNATAVISGAGTLQYTPFTFTNSGQKITVTTQTPLNYGTWTATITGGSVAGTTTYTGQQGYYTIVGNLVYVEATIGITAATGTGNAIIGGLPFTVKNLTNYFPIGNISLSSAAWAWSGTTGTQLNFRPQANTTTALVDSLKSAGAAFLQMTNGAATFAFSAWYQI